MGLPLDNGFDSYHSYSYYQGVMAGELVATFAVFIVVQSIHYCLWGH